MDSGLSRYIAEYGGKHGGLLFARDKWVTVSDISVWKNGENPNLREIHRICYEAAMRTGKIIIRTSVTDDWRGIIDQMPTKKFSILGIPKWDLEWKVQEWIADIQATLEEDAAYVQEHAGYEGTHYETKDVTFSLSPYYGDITGMGTEHPNFEDGLLIDAQEIDDVTFNEHHRYDLFKWQRVDDSTRSDAWLRSRDTLENVTLLRENALRVREAIRKLWVDQDMTYQFEFCWDKEVYGPVLLQIREFTPKNPLVLNDGVTPNLRYFMGNDGSSITLPIFTEKYLDLFDVKEQPYAGHIKNGFWQYRRWDLKNNAKWIIVTVQSCLSHILAQPTISTIKRGWFALLAVQRAESRHEPDPTKPITVFHSPESGIEWKQEK